MKILSPAQRKAVAQIAQQQSRALSIFRALPQQTPFFLEDCSECLVRGGNRSGKSTLCAVKFAAIALDRPVYGHDGRPIEQRLPHQRGRPLLMWTIGYQVNHIGDTIYRLLFRPGLFKIIREPRTGHFTTFKPWDPEHRKHAHRVKPSPPLIPPSMIHSKAWENKGSKVFNTITLKNGTEIKAYTSTGEPKQGDPVDIIWIDEAIKYPAHVAEWEARLSDTKGRLFWSSWPRMVNHALVRMTERAKEQEDRLEPDVREFVFTFSDNPFIDEEEKRKRLEGWSEDERRARDLGEYLTDNVLVYPSFNKRIHTAIQDDPETSLASLPEASRREDPLSQVLRANGGEPPADWTHELVLDPGTAKPAVLFCAIPPPQYGDFAVVYDEIYTPRLNADQLADRILNKIKGKAFNRFIIDAHAGRQTPMGFGLTVEQNYADAFRRRGIWCRETGSFFTYGSDDWQARTGVVQQWLAIRGNGTPKLRVVVNRCPNLVHQFGTYQKRILGEVVDEKPARGQYDDVIVCLEYWASRNPQYVSSRLLRPRGSPAYEYLKRRQLERAEKARAGESDTVHVGPGPAEHAA